MNNKDYMKTRYKMYKSGKHWVFSGMLMLLGPMMMDTTMPEVKASEKKLVQQGNNDKEDAEQLPDNIIVPVEDDEVVVATETEESLALKQAQTKAKEVINTLEVSVEIKNQALTDIDEAKDMLTIDEIVKATQAVADKVVQEETNQSVSEADEKNETTKDTEIPAKKVEDTLQITDEPVVKGTEGSKSSDKGTNTKMAPSDAYKYQPRPKPNGKIDMVADIKKMSNLTAAQKEKYIKWVNEMRGKTFGESAEVRAGHAWLNAETLNYINGLQNLTADDLAGFEAKIDKNWDYENIMAEIQVQADLVEKIRNMTYLQVNDRNELAKKIIAGGPADVPAVERQAEAIQHIRNNKSLTEGDKTKLVTHALTGVTTKNIDATLPVLKERESGMAAIRDMPHLTEEDKNLLTSLVFGFKEVQTIKEFVENKAKPINEIRGYNPPVGEDGKQLPYFQSAQDRIVGKIVESLDDNERKMWVDKADAMKFVMDQPQLTDREKEDFLREIVQEGTDRRKNIDPKIAPLVKAKADAINQIRELPTLNDQFKYSFVLRVNRAKTLEEVGLLLAEAKYSEEIAANKFLTANDKSRLINQVMDSRNPNNQNKADIKLIKDRVYTMEVVRQATNLTEREQNKLSSGVFGINGLGTFDWNAKLREQIIGLNKEMGERQALKDKIKEDLKDLNLPESDKQATEKLVDDATEIPDINKIWEDAKNKSDANNARELKAAQDAAKEAIKDMNLKDERQNIEQKIEDAKHPNDLLPIVEDARAISDANDAADLLAAKNKAKETLKGLNLKPEQLADFNKLVDESKTISEVEEIVKRAEKLSEINDARDAGDLEAAKKAAKESIERMNLKPEQLAESLADLEKATDINTIDDIIKAAREKSNANDAADLLAWKADANAKLDKMNLSEEELNKAKQDIADATNKPKIDSIVSEAQILSDLNDARDRKEKLEKAKREAMKIIEKLNLTDEQRDLIDADLNAAQIIERVDEIQKEAQAASDANDVRELREAKDKALEKLKTITPLSDTERSQFVDAIENSKTISEVNEVVKAAEKKAIENIELLAVKDMVIESINEMNLDQKDKDDAIAKVQSAENAERVYEIFEAAQELSNQNDLRDAKAKALETLKNLKLKPSQKAYFEKNIDNATNVPEVDLEMRDAQGLHENNVRNVNEAREDAEKIINELNLTTDEANVFLEQLKTAEWEEDVDAILDAARDKAAQNDLQKVKDESNAILDMLEHLSDEESWRQKIKDATSVNDVFKVVEEAFAENLKNAKDAAEVDLNKLNLTNEQRESFMNRLEDAFNAEELEKITEIVKEATLLSAENDKLDKLKQDAKNEIKNLNLTEDDKKAFQDAVDKATDEAGVNKVLNDAKAKATEKDAADKAALDKLKQDAKNEIKDLNLTEDDKKAFQDAVDKATDEAGVNKALNDAKAKATEKDALDKLKQDAKNEINGLNLTEDDKKAFQNAVDKATDEAGVNKVLNDAKAKATEKDAADKAAKDALDKLKQDAKNEINGLNLTEDDKKAFQDAVDKATDEAGVNKVLNDAKAKAAKKDALDKLKQDAKNEIKDLNLAEDDKKAFQDAVDKATDEAGVNKALNDAKAKATEKDPKDNQDALNAAKDEAKKQIDALKNLDAKEKEAFKNEIDAQTDVNKVKPIVDKATKADKTKSPNKDIPAVMLRIHATDGQLLLQIDDVLTDAKWKKAFKNPTTLETAIKKFASERNYILTDLEIRQVSVAMTNFFSDLALDENGDYIFENGQSYAIIVELKRLENKQNDKDDLKKMKEDAKREIDGLDNLSTDSKNMFKNQIDNQKDAKGIIEVVENAKNLKIEKSEEVNVQSNLQHVENTVSVEQDNTRQKELPNTDSAQVNQSVVLTGLGLLLGTIGTFFRRKKD